MAAGRAAAERATSAQAHGARADRPHGSARSRAHLLRTTALATLVIAGCLAQPALAAEADRSERGAVAGAAVTTARGFGGVPSIQSMTSGPARPAVPARPAANPAPSPAIGGAFASVATSAERLAELNERIVSGPGDALADVIAEAVTGVERSLVDHANQVRDGGDEAPSHGRDPRPPRSPAEPSLSGSRDDLVLAPGQTPPDGVAGGAPGDSALLPKPRDPEREPVDRDPRAPGGPAGVETPAGDGAPRDDRGETEHPLPEGRPKDDHAPGGDGVDDDRGPAVELPVDEAPPRDGVVHERPEPAESAERGSSHEDERSATPDHGRSPAASEATGAAATAD